MNHFWKQAPLGLALMTALALAPAALQAQDRDHARSYHDKQHNDDHEWNNHETRAYRIYLRQNHRRYHDFSRLKENDQQAYWGWRHEHSDALLKIDIR